MFETAALPTASILTDPIILSFFAIVILGAIIASVLFILRALFRLKLKENRSANQVVMQILVPKERKSEGQGGQAGQEDRLEQIREEIGITETFFSAIAGLRAQRGVMNWIQGRTDNFSFEIVAHKNLISFYAAVPRKLRPFIEQQLHAQYPYAQIEEMTDYNIFTEKSSIVGAYLSGKQKHVFPFKTYKKMDSDPLNVLLNVLGKTYTDESALAVQFIVRSANRKWRRKGVRIVREVKKGERFEAVTYGNAFTRGLKKFFKGLGSVAAKKPENKLEEKYHLSSMEEEMLKGIEEKLSKGGMDVTVRLLSISDNQEATRLNLDNLINAFSQYNLYRYGNEFNAIIPKKQAILIRDFIYRSFNEKRRLVLNTEEMASFWHLPLHSTEAPNIKWLTGRRAPPPSNLPTEGLSLGYIDYRGTRVNVFMKDADRRRHLYIIGKSGGGKSVYIAGLAVQDIKNGNGVCVVDPHGDLVEYVLQHVPKERADDVIIFNPSDMARPIGLNMLEARTDDEKDFAVQEMIAIFYKLFPPEMIGPMFEHNMRNVMLTLMADLNDPGTVIDIPRMFTDDDYVKIYLKKLKDPVVRSFWEKEMAKTSDFHKSEMLGYLISKVGRFVENEMMRNIMGQQKSGFNFREIMDNKKILLVNLAKGKTGEVNAKLLGLIIVAKLQMAAMGRAELPEEQRNDFYLYIDEFQNFITDSISTILSEARKYRLDLIIAHQYMGQLTDEKGHKGIRDAVLGNAGTICCGRIGPEDAEILAKEFAPTFGSYDLLNTPMYSWYTKLLIDNTASKPFLMQTFPPKRGNPELSAAIKELSRLKFGRDRSIVEAEIMERTKLGVAESGGKTNMIEASL
ncbi:MAG: type IV secretory system conjugative DNA transfer family protein [Candidatus Magasanikbacteria bacterium]|nr:type IV secretory system conjugative DNA transfer family protein [Candidatus Magasanikbacteria bacterium]